MANYQNSWPIAFRMSRLTLLSDITVVQCVQYGFMFENPRILLQDQLWLFSKGVRHTHHGLKAFSSLSNTRLHLV